MVTIYKSENVKKEEEGTLLRGELRGLSTDTKPTKIGDKTIANGSQFIEIDTGKVFLYDAASETWKEV